MCENYRVISPVGFGGFDIEHIDGTTVVFDCGSRPKYNVEKLASIFRALATIAERTKVVLPLHPRTAKVVAAAGIDTSLLTIIPPASYLETLSLEKHAQVVITDSGGVQKEAFFLETPSIILREETEWVEIVENGAGILAGADYERILTGYEKLKNERIQFPPIFGDGQAAEKALEHILDYLS